LTFLKTSKTLKAGSKTLPRNYYTQPDILRQEFINIFQNNWICIGRNSDLTDKGQYITVQLGDESAIVLKDKKDEIKAFFNVCRHRGTRICNNQEGKFSNTIQCPYHGWTYDLNGKLVGSPHMEKINDFKKIDYPLFPIQIKEWEGFIFINLSKNPSEFKLEYKPLINRFSEWGINDIEIYKSKVYNVNCNWKLIIQNFSECYHCPMIHKSLSEITSYLGGRNDLVSGPFLGGYMEMNSESITIDGKLCGPIFKNLSKRN